MVLSFRKEKVYGNVHIFCLVGGTEIIGSGTANNLQQQRKAAKRERATLRGSFFLSFVDCNFLKFLFTLSTTMNRSGRRGSEYFAETKIYHEFSCCYELGRTSPTSHGTDDTTQRVGAGNGTTFQICFIWEGTFLAYKTSKPFMNGEHGPQLQ